MDRSLQLEFMQTAQRFGKVNMFSVFNHISKGEFFILETLYRHKQAQPDSEGMYVSIVARKMQASPPSISRTLKSLEGRGYIERSVDKEDRRNTFIRLSEKGEAIHAKTKKNIQAFTDGLVREMGEEKMRQLLSLWNQLIDITLEQINKLNKGEQ